MAPRIGAANWIDVDSALRVGIQRTLRIPDDGAEYPLPPALGRLPVYPAERFPALFGSADAGVRFVVPIHPQDAAWLQFRGRAGDPRAVKIGTGGVDALTGRAWTETLEGSPQNYIVVPDQPWLDGFKVASGVVRQFVAVPFGGTSVEHQLTGRDEGGITIAVYAPQPGAIVDSNAEETSSPTRALGVGAGGRITQRVYPDRHGLHVWVQSPVTIHIHLADAGEFSRLTGEAVPPSPIDAATYARFGLPWFEVYDSARGAVPATEELSRIKSVDALAGGGESDQTEHERPPNVRPIPPRSRRR